MSIVFFLVMSALYATVVGVGLWSLITKHPYAEGFVGIMVVATLTYLLAAYLVLGEPT